MAAAPSTYEVSDICLGKPALMCMSAVSVTVGDALAALKRSGEPYLSVWACDHQRVKSGKRFSERCRCVGKVCLGDIICFLAEEDKIRDPASALLEPIHSILPSKVSPLVRHLELQASLVEAIDLALDGAQNLVIPIYSPFPRKRQTQIPSFLYSLHENHREYCWLSQEDLIRYLLNSIYLFTSISNQSIESLKIIDVESVMTVHYDDPASSALSFLSSAVRNQTAVGVLNEDDKLIAEISYTALNNSDESVAAAIATLSIGELIHYIYSVSPPEEVVHLVKKQLIARNLQAAMDLFDDDMGNPSSSSAGSSYSSSSDDESLTGKTGRLSRSLSRTIRSRDPVACYPWSSLVAVMVQAISHRLNYLWVVDDDGNVVGIVTFAGMLKVFRERLKLVH